MRISPPGPWAHTEACFNKYNQPIIQQAVLQDHVTLGHMLNLFIMFNII